MACYIASNNNRFYVARESGYGTIAAVTAANRFAATRLGMNEVSEKVRRRDKTGTRTYQGLPTELRRRTTFEVEAYLSSRGSATEAPRYGALLESAMGGTVRVSSGGSASIQGLVLTFAGEHGLSEGMVVTAGGELRLVAGVLEIGRAHV